MSISFALTLLVALLIGYALRRFVLWLNKKDRDLRAYNERKKQS